MQPHILTSVENKSPLYSHFSGICLKMNYTGNRAKNVRVQSFPIKKIADYALTRWLFWCTRHSLALI